jgi:hypothetical protein
MSKGIAAVVEMAQFKQAHTVSVLQNTQNSQVLFSSVNCLHDL